MLGYSIQLLEKLFDFSNHDSPEADPDAFISKFEHFVASLRFMSPYQANRAAYLDNNLFSPATTHIYVRVNFHLSPLQPVYQGPYKVFAKFSKYFKPDMQHGINIISIDCIKTTHLPSISSQIVSTTRGRVVRPPQKSSRVLFVM